ncbi:hypothetical protein CTAYLR_010368 [Chrysophaeum taylorii]|uniref:Uncharacterized protein n=1 Tax=Chrysophaeum taylorii TaxID=2483200 RepID=A0AAD7U8M1_9STRA|nr:hypothetical protein CTAYLR_010368 [Chrysophaeum taylorii]
MGSKKRATSRGRSWWVRCGVGLVGVVWVGLVATYARRRRSVRFAASPKVFEPNPEVVPTPDTPRPEVVPKPAPPHEAPPKPEELEAPRARPPEPKTREKVGVAISSASGAGTEYAMELDPRTGLWVPVWWEGGVREDESIFLMIASYRDFQCRETIASALSRARVPTNVKIAVVQQNREGDVGCAEPVKPCAEAPDQPLCRFGPQIAVYEMAADEASGPVYARHVGSRMYRGEAFALQVDAHCTFVADWDVDILAQWRATQNDMAVLSTYLTDVEGSLAPSGTSLRKTRPIMCNSDFEGSGATSYLRHNSQPEAVPSIPDCPMLQPFWAAGFSFGRGHFVTTVKYDCCLPMVFMGEEISIGIRGWTHGYDFYAPRASVVFHEYAQHSRRRRDVPKFWETRRLKRPANSGQASLKRLTALIGMGPDVLDYDRTLLDEYGLGTKRDVLQFYKLFLLDVKNKRAQPLCRFVESGAMHREFSKFLTPHGVDYSKIDFDVQAFLDDRLYAPVATRLRRAISQPHNLRPALAALKVALRAMCTNWKNP